MIKPDDRDACGRRRVYLMRHGAVSYFDSQGTPVDPRDVRLTGEGRAQASAARDMLAHVAFDRIVCSGMPRARETAEVVAGGRGPAIEERPAFREARAHRFRDLAAEELEERIARAYDGAGEADARFIGGDAFADLWERVTAGWEDLVAEPSWQTLLLVAHDAVNRIILSHVAGVGLVGLRAFEQDLGCINVIDVGPPGAFLRAVNLTPYDPAKMGLWLTSMERVYRHYRHSTEAPTAP